MTEMYVFPDTNVFLHYPPISQIDWKSLVGADQVRIVLCNEVIRELDDKKSDNRLGNRASRAIKDIDEADEHGQEISDGVKVEVFSRTFRRDDLSGDCSPDNGDDRIVTLVQQYQLQHPERAVAIVTEDYGMKSRCKTCGVTVFRLDQSIRLENPHDELAKKFKQVSQELAVLKARQPKLLLRARTSSDLPSQQGPPTFSLKNSWQPIDVRAKLSEIAKGAPKQLLTPRKANEVEDEISALAVTTHIHTFGGSVSDEEWKTYNRHVDAYLHKYAEHLELANLIGDAKHRTLSLELTLANDGNSLATDIDVRIEWPACVRLLAEAGTEEAKWFEHPPEPPTPPERPSLIRNLMSNTLMSSIGPSLGHQIDFDRFMPVLNRNNEFEPSVALAKENGCNVINVSLQKLKHGHRVAIGLFLITIGAWDDCKPFEATYSISATELPEHISAKLPVIIKVEKRDASAS